MLTLTLFLLLSVFNSFTSLVWCQITGFLCVSMLYLKLSTSLTQLVQQKKLPNKLFCKTWYFFPFFYSFFVFFIFSAHVPKRALLHVPKSSYYLFDGYFFFFTGLQFENRMQWHWHTLQRHWWFQEINSYLPRALSSVCSNLSSLLFFATLYDLPLFSTNLTDFWLSFFFCSHDCGPYVMLYAENFNGKVVKEFTNVTIIILISFFFFFCWYIFCVV